MFLNFCLILVSGFIMFIGIRLAKSKFRNLFGVCVSNEKTSLYHDPMLRGLGVLYIISLLPAFVFSNNLFSSMEIILIISATLIGFIDDKYGISQLRKLLFLTFLIFANEIFTKSFVDINSLNILIKISLFVFFNLFFNQIDGINGLAGSTFILTCCALFFISKNDLELVSLVSIILVTLIYLNTNLRGKIGIQGEAGSFFMGSVIFLLYTKLGNNYDIIYVILFLFPILSDVMCTTLIRLWYVQNLFISHRNHLYQRLVAKNKSHAVIAALFSAVQLIVITITILIYNFDHFLYKFLCILLLSSFFIAINFRYSLLIHKEKF